MKVASLGLVALLALLLLFVLAGCASPSAMYQGMSAEQINAAAKDNKAVFDCSDVEAPSFGGGTVHVKRRSMVIDSGTVKYGRFVAKTCDDIEFTNTNKPEPVPAIDQPRVLQ